MMKYLKKFESLNFGDKLYFKFNNESWFKFFTKNVDLRSRPLPQSEFEKIKNLLLEYDYNIIFKDHSKSLTLNKNPHHNIHEYSYILKNLRSYPPAPELSLYNIPSDEWIIIKEYSRGTVTHYLCDSIIGVEEFIKDKFPDF